MSKEQRIVFVLSKTPEGKLKINMTFYPKLAKDKESFEKLSVFMQEMQTTAAHIGKYVMESLNKFHPDTSSGENAKDNA